MRPLKPDLMLLENDALWADPNDSSLVSAAGINFLHDTLMSLTPGAPLILRVRALGDELIRIRARTGGDPSKATANEVRGFCFEANTLGTLGWSLWHLRGYLHQRGIKFELGELSKISGTSESDMNRLRGQGFLFFAAANLAKQGFEVEFIPRSKTSPTPDLLLTRDGLTFGCEVTTRQPLTRPIATVEAFYHFISGILRKKEKQLAAAGYSTSVLVIDCTPFWDWFGLENVPVEGPVVWAVAPGTAGPASGSAPLIRYGGSAHSAGIQRLERSLDGTAVHTLILWKILCEATGESTFQRVMAYRVLGTLANDGAFFWRYFEKALVFPGTAARDFMARLPRL